MIYDFDLYSSEIDPNKRAHMKMWQNNSKLNSSFDKGERWGREGCYFPEKIINQWTQQHVQESSLNVTLLGFLFLNALADTDNLNYKKTDRRKPVLMWIFPPRCILQILKTNCSPCLKVRKEAFQDKKSKIFSFVAKTLKLSFLLIL